MFLKNGALFSAVLLIISNIAYGADPTDLVVNGEKCSLHGNAKKGSMEFRQNVFKNRFDSPEPSNIDRTITLSSFIGAAADATGFSQNKAVEVEGFVFAVKVGGVETCNCKAKESLFRDTHIELTLNDEETGPENRVIIEITPRFRQMMEEQGVDWTTSTLKQLLIGKMVRVQGWLFFDSSHRTEDFGNDPDDNIGKKNWRTSCWEIHPITSLEIIGEDNEFIENTESDDMESSTLIASAFTNKSSPSTSKKATMNTSSPQDLLILILLGAILGMVGQGIRVLVGLKKVGDVAANEGVKFDDVFKAKQLLLSLMIAFAIGAIAGVLAAVTDINVKIDQSTIIAFIVAGYAGTDFIEGFIRKNPNVVTPTRTPTPTPTPTPPTPNA